MSNPLKNVLVVGVTGGGQNVSWGTGANVVEALINSDKDWNIKILVRSESLKVSIIPFNINIFNILIMLFKRMRRRKRELTLLGKEVLLLLKEMY